MYRLSAPYVPEAGIFVAHHRGIVVLGLGTPFGFDLVEVIVEFLSEGPHPFRRHILGGDVLQPVDNPIGVAYRFHKVPGEVLDAQAARGPESAGVSSCSDGSDEIEEGGSTAESFPSMGSTFKSRNPFESSWMVGYWRASTA